MSGHVGWCRLVLADVVCSCVPALRPHGAPDEVTIAHHNALEYNVPQGEIEKNRSANAAIDGRSHRHKHNAQLS